MKSLLDLGDLKLTLAHDAHGAGRTKAPERRGRLRADAQNPGMVYVYSGLQAHLIMTTSSQESGLYDGVITMAYYHRLGGLVKWSGPKPKTSVPRNVRFNPPYAGCMQVRTLRGSVNS